MEGLLERLLVWRDCYSGEGCGGTVSVWGVEGLLVWRDCQRDR